MNPLDILFIVIMIYCLVTGFFRGLIGEFISIIGIVSGFVVANRFFRIIEKQLPQRWISDEIYRDILSFLILFCVVFVIISIIGLIVRYLLKKTKLRWFDRVTGATLALIKGVIVICFALIVLVAFLKPGAIVLKNSRLSPYITQTCRQIVKIGSEDLKQTYLSKLKVLEKEWNK